MLDGLSNCIGKGQNLFGDHDGPLLKFMELNPTLSSRSVSFCTICSPLTVA